MVTSSITTANQKITKNRRFRDYCERYNDFFGFAIFNTPAVGIGDPKIVNELMNNKNFTMRMACNLKILFSKEQKSLHLNFSILRYLIDI